jgi:hypothetical protein
MSEAEQVAEEVAQPEVIDQEVQQEPQAGSAPAEGEVVKPEVDEAQVEKDRINHAFAEKQAKIAKANRLREEAEAKTKELEERLAKLEQVPVDIPELPDYLDVTDDEYKLAVRQRDEAIRQAAVRENAKQAEQARQQQAQQEAVRKQQEAVNQKAQAYVERAKALEVSNEDLQKAGQTIVEFGVSDEFVDHLSTHEEGPILAVYLAANPMELDALRSMSPYEQAIKIENEIRPKASQLKKKPSQAPDPATTLDGNGAKPGVDPWLAGGTYS